MMTKFKRFFAYLSIPYLSVLLMVPLVAYAAIDAYDFAGDMEKERRFKHLIEELRCPKCQNQNIADSSAPLAKDLKNRVYKLMLEGRSNAEITQYLVDRYGDFVSYRPPLKPSTWFLWFAPVFVLVVALIVIVVRVTRRAKQATGQSEGVDKLRVQALLKTYDGLSDGLDDPIKGDKS